MEDKPNMRVSQWKGEGTIIVLTIIAISENFRHCATKLRIYNVNYFSCDFQFVLIPFFHVIYDFFMYTNMQIGGLI